MRWGSAMFEYVTAVTGFFGGMATVGRSVKKWIRRDLEAHEVLDQVRFEAMDTRFDSQDKQLELIVKLLEKK